MTRQMVQNIKQDKVIELMCEVLDFAEESEQKVIGAVNQMGLPTFFASIDALDIEDIEKERIRALKDVIDTKVKAIEKMKGGQ